MISERKENFATFDWNSIKEDEDAIGADWRESRIYVLKGFRKDSNNYTHINIDIPEQAFSAIWSSATRD